jgi:hypothetical protein
VCSRVLGIFGVVIVLTVAILVGLVLLTASLVSNQPDPPQAQLFRSRLRFLRNTCGASRLSSAAIRMMTSSLSLEVLCVEVAGAAIALRP